jgi:hypothetical protein
MPKPAVERDAASSVDGVASVEDAGRPEHTKPRAHLPRQFAASAVASRLTGSRRSDAASLEVRERRHGRRVSTQLLAAGAKPVSASRVRLARPAADLHSELAAEMRAPASRSTVFPKVAVAGEK